MSDAEQAPRIQTGPAPGAADPNSGRPFFPLAVIELGTTAIRMTVGESDGRSELRVLEQLVHGVSLGKDTYTGGEIQRKTIQECIRVLRGYRRKLTEYQCTDPRSIRVIATSAIRESSNRLAVLDRIYIATGLVVEVIDDAEIARVTYQGIRPLLNKQVVESNDTTVVVEVGGGSTEVLVLRGKDILYSQPCRLGSLRLQQQFSTTAAPRSEFSRIMSGQIQRSLEPLLDIIPSGSNVQIITLGGDMRFTASLLNVEAGREGLRSIPISQLQSMLERLLPMPVDWIMQEFHIELSQAETLIPTLLTNLKLAELLQVEQLRITGFNLRDALLRGMLGSSQWSPDFRNQIVNSSLELAKRCQVDLPQAIHVANLSVKIFQGLHAHHSMDSRCETLLYTAALLSRVGMFVGISGYHKHSFYLIQHSEVFGLNSLDQTLVALVARYHRRATPRPSHEAFARLDRESRVIVTRLAAILRIADALDHTGTQRISDIECTIENNRLTVTPKRVAGDLSLERMELRRQVGLFEDTFGLEVMLQELGRQAFLR